MTPTLYDLTLLTSKISFSKIILVRQEVRPYGLFKLNSPSPFLVDKQVLSDKRLLLLLTCAIYQ